jgi:ADP-L-glycero-D-manno-heptose 6-epimerase
MILLTGAAGFIGSNILKALNDQGRDDIICVDDLTDGRKMQNLAGSKFYYYCDYRDLGKGKTREAELSAIIHQGANSDTTESNGRNIMLANYSFSVDLFDLAQASNCPLIYASSAAVYGPGRPQCIESPEYEHPTTPYAISKWAFDEYVRGRLTQAVNRVVGLRYFNVYGPGEEHKGRLASVAYHLIQQVNNGEKPTLFAGSKDIFRDFVYIDDVVQVVLWALKEAPSGIYNVGTGQAQSFYDLFDELAFNAISVQQRNKFGAECAWIPMPKELRNQYQFRTQASLTRLRAAGYTKEFLSLSKGIEKYWGHSRLS